MVVDKFARISETTDPHRPIRVRMSFERRKNQLLPRNTRARKPLHSFVLSIEKEFRPIFVEYKTLDQPSALKQAEKLNFATSAKLDTTLSCKMSCQVQQCDASLSPKLALAKYNPGARQALSLH